MEPSGLMDDKSPSGFNKSNCTPTVRDVADEEILHSSGWLSSFSDKILYTREPNSQPNSLQLRPNELPEFTEINLDGFDQSSYIESCDQAKSSKLLNSIGSRLRRSSNLLLAPKLVGQYLLGITIRSWSQFLDTSRMMKTPSNTNQLQARLLTNLNYFQGNYLCVSLILIIYCILTSPFLMLAIVAYLTALYLVTKRSASGKNLKLLGFRLNLQQQYSFVTIVSVPMLWVAGAPSAVFWVIGASFVVVGLHASMYSIADQPVELAGGRQTTPRVSQATNQTYAPPTSVTSVVISQNYPGLGRVYEI